MTNRPTQNHKSHKRRKLFVDREVQGMLLSRILLHWCSAGMVCFLYLFALQLITTPEVLSFSQHVQLMWDNYGSLVIVFITLFPIFAYDTLKLSHQFAGPMVSFRRALKQLAQGEVIPTIAFRKKDFWQDMATQLNRVACRLGQSQERAEAK